MPANILFISIGFLFIYPVLGQENPVRVTEFIFEEAPFKSCHASTIAETGSGLAVAWFGGTHEKHKDVEIWFSRKMGRQWTAPVSVADGIVKSERYPCWNPVLYKDDNNVLYLFYKVGPSPSEWWGMMKFSRDEGRTWSEGKRLPEGFLGPIKNKPVRISGNILLCPSSTEHNGWKVHMERYNIVKDSWDNWVSVDPNSVYNVIQPTILRHSEGTIQILCRSREGFIMTSSSKDGGISWTGFEQTCLPNPNSGIDAVTLKKERHVLVYNHTGVPKGKWGGNRYPLNIAISPDGQRWFASIVLEEQEGEYSYPAIIQTDDGLLHILYTWKRLRIKHVVVDPVLLPENDIRIWD